MDGVPGTVYAIPQVPGSASSLGEMQWNPGQGEQGAGLTC